MLVDGKGDLVALSFCLPPASPDEHLHAGG